MSLLFPLIVILNLELCAFLCLCLCVCVHPFILVESLLYWLYFIAGCYSNCLWSCIVHNTRHCVHALTAGIQFIDIKVQSNSTPFPCTQVFLLFSLAVHGAAYKGLEKLAQPFLGPNGELLECGTDLSKSYFSE